MRESECGDFHPISMVSVARMFLAKGYKTTRADRVVVNFGYTKGLRYYLFSPYREAVKEARVAAVQALHGLVLRGALSDSGWLDRRGRYHVIYNLKRPDGQDVLQEIVNTTD